MSQRLITRLIWIATFSSHFVHEFNSTLVYHRRNNHPGGWDRAMETTSGEEAWHVANAAVKGYKHHRKGFSNSVIEPEWD